MLGQARRPAVAVGDVGVNGQLFAQVQFPLLGNLDSTCILTTHAGWFGQELERGLVEDGVIAQDDVVRRKRLEVARRVRRQREGLLQYSKQP